MFTLLVVKLSCYQEKRFGRSPAYIHTGLLATLADLVVGHAVDGPVFSFRKGGREKRCVEAAGCGIEGEYHPAFAIGAAPLDFALVEELHEAQPATADL